MDWFRHYHGCAFDPKWRTVARRASSNIATVVFVWDTLMESASQDPDRGSVLSWSAEVIADHLMCDVDEIARIRVEMERIGVIVADRLTAWDKRQPSDPTAAERMRRYRARRKTNDTPDDAEQPNGDDNQHRNDRNDIGFDRNDRNADGLSHRNDRNAEGPDRNALPKNRTEQNREEQNHFDLKNRESKTNTTRPPAHAHTRESEPADESDDDPGRTGKTVARRRAPVFDDAAFNRFWLAYPRKTAKGRARSAFGTAIRKVDLDTMLAGLERSKRQWSRDQTEARFIPHPASWLNAERWADESGPAPPCPSTPGLRIKSGYGFGIS